MGRVSMPQGKGSLMHNRRDYAKYGMPLPENIDPSRSHLNVTYVDRDLREAYGEIFGEALHAYNDKQKRADRKIGDYYDHIKKSKNGEKLFYEDVVQWGSKDDFINSPVVAQKAKEALIEYVVTFAARNPNLRIIGAYIHMDEASPHLHLDYVPVATGYKKGLAARNSLERAMKEMGFVVPEKQASRNNNATKLWKESERAVFGEICRLHGLDVEEEIKNRGRASLSVSEYKAARDKMLAELEKEMQPLREAMQELRDLKVEIDDVGDNKTALPGSRVILKKNDFETMQQQAKAYVANRDEIESVRERAAAVEQREQAAERREKELEQQRKDMEAMRELITRRDQESSQRYMRQLHVNRLLDEAEKDNEEKKRSIAALEAVIKKNATDTLQRERNAVQAAVEPLKATIAEQEKKIDTLETENRSLAETARQIARGLRSILRAAQYALDYFAKGFCANILQSALKTGKQWLIEDGHEDLTNDLSPHLSETICANIERELYFLDGIEGKGLYASTLSPEAPCLMRFDSVKEAQEAFPNCKIHDHSNDPNIRHRLRIYQKQQEQGNKEKKKGSLNKD